MKIKLFFVSIFLTMLASLFHFLYDWTDNFFVALVAPVNESVFEHIKIIFYPLLILGIIFSFSKKFNPSKWIISLIIAPIMMLFLYYFSNGIIGEDIIWVNIFLTFLTFYFSLLLTDHINFNISLPIGIVIIGLIISFLIYLTFYPLKSPIFLDSQTNTYGYYMDTKE